MSKAADSLVVSLTLSTRPATTPVEKFLFLRQQIGQCPPDRWRQRASSGAGAYGGARGRESSAAALAECG